MSGVKRSDDPQDDLTWLASAMTDALEAHPDYREGITAVVMLSEGQRGGLTTFGFEDPNDSLEDVLSHAAALFEAHGLTLQVHRLGKG